MIAAALGCKVSVANLDAGSTPKDGSTLPICTNDIGNGDKDNGEACVCPKECSSGFCADGVCCDSACDGTCQSCGLPTSLGQCSLTPAGVKPRVASQCAVQPSSTCGLDGTCDGAGKCRTYQPGTVCVPGACEGDAVVGVNVCDGAGNCGLGPTGVCAPFSCDKATNKCFPTCASDANCVAGRKCVNGSCGPKMNGVPCPTGQGSECDSGHCTDGVCCNETCDGVCRSCNQVGIEGRCSPVPAGQGHPLCAKQAPATCGTTGVCDGFSTCALYPPNSPCGPSSCSGVTAMNTARACDGLGTCEASELRMCGNFRCVGTACTLRCTTIADCADGIACVAGTCGPKVDGQACAADADCQNQHCVRDVATSPTGICCNTACAGACRSCALAGAVGRCSPVASGGADPRRMCTDTGAASCGTNSRCDGAMACQRYASGTVCGAETCLTDVYTGPSTCNASGQCLKPSAMPCFPYHCNATKCFTSCTTDAQCVTPRVCGMNGMISSCGLKPAGATCSAGSECMSTFCSQGVCCNSACNTACHACNLSGTTGICSNVASGADPRGLCAVQAQSTCGTTGQCAAGQCAVRAANTQCIAASCPTASTRTPPSMCNGTGTCVTPGNANCAPGRCDTTTLTCNNTCTTNAQCTAPATCVGGSCGLLPAGGSCTATNQCQAGLTCYLREGNPGVCCNSACGGTCESCRIAGAIGICSAVAAGGADPAGACVAGTPTSCGLDGRCAGTNTSTNGAGTARCRFLGTGQGCRNQSCVNSTTGASTLTAAANCTGTGACSPLTTSTCGSFKCLNATQCATACSVDTDCIAGVTCIQQTHRCGAKLGNGSLCAAATDCTTANCVFEPGSTVGVCCNSACGGVCQTCSTGTCSPMANGAVDPMCGPANTLACGMAGTGNTGTCTNGACTTREGLACSDGNACTTGDACRAGTCTAGTAVTCTASDQCHVAGVCAPATGLCSNPAAANGTTCNDGSMCSTGEVCTAGICGGGTAKVCTASDQCHVAGVCAPATGLCSNPAAANGTTCNDGSMCSTGEVCTAGICGGGTAKVCTASDQCHVAGVCAPATGICSNPNAANGTTCNDGNMCTAGDACQAGACTGAAKVCPASDQCHVAGTCDPGSGNCSNPTKADDSTCNDGNACTTGEACQAGACTGGTPKVCTASDQCHVAGICSPATGICSNPAEANNTPCDDGDLCTTGDACSAGVCTGAPLCDASMICLVGICI